MSFSEIVKATGPAAGASGLFALGAWASQFAKHFEAPFISYAQFACLALMYIGGFLAIAQISVSAIKSVSATWRGVPEQNALEAEPAKHLEQQDPPAL